MMNCTTHDYELADLTGRRYRLNSNHLESLGLCLSFMRLVVEGDMNVRVTSQRRSWPARELFTVLAQHLAWLHGYWRLFSRQYTFHPYVVLFLRTYREHAIRHLEGFSLSTRTVTGPTVEEVLEDFVLQMRAEAKKCRLRKRAADWQGKYERNADRLIELMGRVSKHVQRFTLVELELDYLASRLTPKEVSELIETLNDVERAEADAYWGGRSLDQTEPAQVKVPFAKVQSDRKHLFANMKGKTTLFKELQGYVWRVQFTPVAGYGLRLSLIFDGMQMDPAGLGGEIGSYWQSITRGQGCFRVLEPWPAIDTARRITALADNAKVERKTLRQELMDRMGGVLLAVQCLPYPGCNLFATGLVHRRSAAHQEGVRRPVKPTRGAGSAARIRNRHSFGAKSTWPHQAEIAQSVVGVAVPVHMPLLVAENGSSELQHGVHP
ncbi:hypothetical protein WG899_19465 [Paucibacter sp. AS339]|uniref:hypothetical protein n=1 Tax=Paucibacter hankyongi TaxID=3133434 RepID=UPI00309CFD1B